MTENFPNLMRKKSQGPANTEGPNEDEANNPHSKTRYNQNGKI